jgi:catechol 2,3-dioxygenase-like lactoylglutathione lyase family enzyme
MNQPAEKHVGFEGMNPILRVKDVQASVNYYTRVLGFKVDFQTEIFASVSRDQCHLFLSEGDQGHFGSWVYIGVEDVEALLKEYQKSGAKVRHLPTNYSWAREMQVEDPDGNVLRMGSEPLEGQPIGEWLDMNGATWLPQADGGWARKE